MKAVYVLSICPVSFSAAAGEKKTTLSVSGKSYAVSELLKRPEIEKISSNNPSKPDGVMTHTMAGRRPAILSCISAVLIYAKEIWRPYVKPQNLRQAIADGC